MVYFCPMKGDQTLENSKLHIFILMPYMMTLFLLECPCME